MSSSRREFFRRAYSYVTPNPDDRGAPMELALYAGHGVDDIPSAHELVARLWKECLEKGTP